MGEEFNKWRDKNPLRIFRKSKGWSQDDLAVAMQVSFSSVAAWEKGSMRPSDVNMDIIKSLVGSKVNIQWLKWMQNKPVNI